MLAQLVTASYAVLQWVALMKAWALAQASAQDENPPGTPNVLFRSKFGQAIAEAQIDTQLGPLLPLELLQAPLAAHRSRTTPTPPRSIMLRILHELPPS